MCYACGTEVTLPSILKTLSHFRNHAHLAGVQKVVKDDKFAEFEEKAMALHFKSLVENELLAQEILGSVDVSVTGELAQVNESLGSLTGCWLCKCAFSSLNDAAAHLTKKKHADNWEIFVKEREAHARGKKCTFCKIDMSKESSTKIASHYTCDKHARNLRRAFNPFQIRPNSY
jgi:hypothetical protein